MAGLLTVEGLGRLAGYDSRRSEGRRAVRYGVVRMRDERSREERAKQGVSECKSGMGCGGWVDERREGVGSRDSGVRCMVTCNAPQACACLMDQSTLSADQWRVVTPWHLSACFQNLALHGPVLVLLAD